jgi:molybdate transport system substrate-binding protein
MSAFVRICGHRLPTDRLDTKRRKFRLADEGRARGAGCAEISPTAEADKSRQMTTKADIIHSVDICRHLSAFVDFLRIRPRLLSALVATRPGLPSVRHGHAAGSAHQAARPRGRHRKGKDLGTKEEDFKPPVLLSSPEQARGAEMKRLASALSKLAAAAALIIATPAQAAEIKLIAAAEMRVLLSLLPAFEKSSGHKVNVVWEIEPTTIQVVERERADAVVIPAPDLDRLLAAGIMLADSRVDVAKSPMGLAVRAGEPKPDISSVEAVKKAVLGAKSVAFSSGPSGAHLAETFGKMGIADEIKDKVARKSHHHRISNMVAARAVDLGFDLASELVHEEGFQYVGPLPPELQYVTVFAAALRTSAASPEAAKALLKFLSAPEAAPAIKQFGMEPG